MNANQFYSVFKSKSSFLGISITETFVLDEDNDVWNSNSDHNPNYDSDS